MYVLLIGGGVYMIVNILQVVEDFVTVVSWCEKGKGVTYIPPSYYIVLQGTY